MQQVYRAEMSFLLCGSELRAHRAERLIARERDKLMKAPSDPASHMISYDESKI